MAAFYAKAEKEERKRKEIIIANRVQLREVLKKYNRLSSTAGTP